METQDNGFLKEIDGVRKEKERLTAAKLFSLTSWLLASSLLFQFSDIPFPWFLMLGCNSQAQDLRSHGGCRIIGPKVAKFLDR